MFSLQPGKYLKIFYLSWLLFISGSSASNTFWDIVVLTAADESQRVIFEEQINLKLTNSELPKSAAYMVVCDPPGYKIGEFLTLIILLTLISLGILDWKFIGHWPLKSFPDVIRYFPICFIYIVNCAYILIW